MDPIKIPAVAFFILVLFCAQAFGQTPAVRIPGTWAVGFVFSPDYCYRTLSADAASQWIADDREKFEHPKMGFTTGPSIIYGLNNRVLLEGGLLFSDKGEVSERAGRFSSFPPPASSATSRWNYHYYYLDVPTKVNYYISTKKVKLFVSGGTSTNIFLKEKVSYKVKYPDGTTKEGTAYNTAPFSRVNLAALAGFGVDYEITDNLQVRVEPIYRQSLTSIIQAPIKGYLYRATAPKMHIL